MNTLCQDPHKYLCPDPLGADKPVLGPVSLEAPRRKHLASRRGTVRGNPVDTGLAGDQTQRVPRIGPSGPSF